MTEKEKRQKGILYNPGKSDELLSEMLDAKELCFQFNNLSASNLEERKQIIRKLFRKTGQIFHIESNLWCDYGYNIKIGENFYMNHNGVILDCAEVEFGDNVFVGPNCSFYTPEHPINIKQRNEGLEYAKSIKIGNNVWIGGSVVVLSGVTIGDNVTIGAGSIVTKDIPSNVIAVGNPCKVMREIDKA